MPQLPDLWFDPQHPPLEDVFRGPIQPVVAPDSGPGAVPDIIGYQRTYKNTARSEIPTLRITASAATGPDDDIVMQSSVRLADEAKRQLGELQVYYDARMDPEPSKPDIE